MHKPIRPRWISALLLNPTRQKQAGWKAKLGCQVPTVLHPLTQVLGRSGREKCGEYIVAAARVTERGKLEGLGRVVSVMEDETDQSAGKRDCVRRQLSCDDWAAAF